MIIIMVMTTTIIIILIKIFLLLMIMIIAQPNGLPHPPTIMNMIIIMIIAKPDGLPHLPTIRPMGKGNNLANGNKEEDWSARVRKIKYILGFWSYYALF